MDALELSLKALEPVKENEPKLVRGELSPADFKPFGAPLGIYEQKDGLFMSRIRVPGGHIETSLFASAAKAAKEAGAKFAHITSRQDIQIHGIEPGKIYALGVNLAKAGFKIRGGGGNTFRNVAACPLSGLIPESIADLSRLVHAFSDAMLQVDKAYSLPRKLKCAFSCCHDDCAGASWHDLGFLAEKNSKGELRFKVFGGGGLGREPAASIPLLDEIAPEDCLRAAVAMTCLFDEHGDRQNRNTARIRFIVRRLGQDAFRKLFLDYYEAAAGSSLPPMKINAKAIEGKPGSQPVKINLRSGDLSIKSMEHLAELAKKYRQPFLRLSQDLSIWLPSIDASELEPLSKEIAALHDHMQVKAHTPLKLMSCIGARTCKIGILDSQAAAARAMEALASLDGDQAKLAEFLEAVSISGCHNSCSGHPVSALGLHGLKKRVGEESKGFFKVSIGGGASKHGAKLGRSEDAWLVSEEELPGFLKSLAQGFMKSGEDVQAYLAREIPARFTKA